MKRTRMTISIDPSLLALARTVVHQTDGLTLASLVARGLRLTITRLERERGRLFRPQAIRLLTGRPRTHTPVAIRKKGG